MCFKGASRLTFAEAVFFEAEVLISYCATNELFFGYGELVKLGEMVIWGSSVFSMVIVFLRPPATQRPSREQWSVPDLKEQCKALLRADAELRVLRFGLFWGRAEASAKGFAVLPKGGARPQLVQIWPVEDPPPRGL